MLSLRTFEIVFSLATFAAVLSGLPWWQIVGLLLACGVVSALVNEIVEQHELKPYIDAVLWAKRHGHAMPVPQMSLCQRSLKRSI